MTQEPRTDSLATRRGVLAGVGLAGIAGAATACGAGGSSSSSAAAADPASSAGGTSAGGAGQGAGALATTSEIPVGGGMVFTDRQVVVTQPTAGDFKAFSAVCTHMGCIVSQVSNGTIDCPCHGSQYSISNGAVVGGPAPRPLTTEHIRVSGDSIFLE